MTETQKAQVWSEILKIEDMRLLRSLKARLKKELWKSAAFYGVNAPRTVRLAEQLSATDYQVWHLKQVAKAEAVE